MVDESNRVTQNGMLQAQTAAANHKLECEEAARAQAELNQAIPRRRTSNDGNSNNERTNKISHPTHERGSSNPL